MWVNKGLQALNIGVIFGENEEKLIMWKRGGTLNPCADCLALDGQIKTAEQWQAAGIEPQSPDLECGGWNCLCRFVLV